MFRLGTRPDRKRTSPAPEANTDSFSPDSALIEIGTSWMFSTLRWAVTSSASRVTASWAWTASGKARASASRLRRRWREAWWRGCVFIVRAPAGWGDGWRPARTGPPGSERNDDRLARPQHRLVPVRLLPGQPDRLDVGAACGGVLVQDHQHLRLQPFGFGTAAEQPLAVGIEHGQA